MKKHIVCLGDSNTHGYCADPMDCADGGDRFNDGNDDCQADKRYTEIGPIVDLLQFGFKNERIEIPACKLAYDPAGRHLEIMSRKFGRTLDQYRVNDRDRQKHK